MDPTEALSFAEALSRLGVPALLALWALASTYVAFRLGMKLIDSLETRNREARENGAMAQQCAAALQQFADTMRLLATKGSD